MQEISRLCPASDRDSSRERSNLRLISRIASKPVLSLLYLASSFFTNFRRVLNALARFPLRAFAAYFRSSRGRLEAALADGLGDTYPEPVPHCQVCRWRDECEARWRRDDHPSLVADLRRDHTARLAAAGVMTVDALGRMDAAQPVAGIGAPVLERLAAQPFAFCQQISFDSAAARGEEHGGIHHVKAGAMRMHK